MAATNTTAPVTTSNGSLTSLPVSTTSQPPSSTPETSSVSSTTRPESTDTSAVSSSNPGSSSSQVSSPSSAPSSTPAATSLSVVTATVSNSDGISIRTVYSTSIIANTNNAPTVASTSPAASSSTDAAGSSLQNQSSGGSGGSAPASTIAPAVVVPVVVVALLLGFGVWFWRRRRASKEAEELRRKEAEEYGFNPNDGALGGTAAGTIAANDTAAMSEADGSGYRGWGATTNARKASTTLGSGSVGAGGIGIARSDSGGNGGYAGNGNHSPNGTGVGGTYSDQNSGDPLVNGSSRPISQDFEGVAALGGAPAAGSRSNTGVKRGPSNASSAYSAGQRSDTSNEAGGSAGLASPSWENQYLNEVDGPYGTSSGAAPVIRDVSARRNTRIEQPSVMPQQARGGISQNF